MKPSLYDGDIIIGTTRSTWCVGNVVVASIDGREVIKRVTKCQGERVWLLGDNAAQTNRYDGIDESAILGVMKVSFPARAVDPPKLRHPHGVIWGLVAAAIMIGFAVLHLFRIDTFVPELSKALGGDRTVTLWVASVLVSAEVFAVPFLLRMRLSLFAQYVSGALGVIIPLFWSLVAIWAYGVSTTTAQLGEFKELPSNWLLIVLNIIWLLYAYVTLWMLGYDHRSGEKQSFVTRWLSRLSGVK